MSGFRALFLIIIIVGNGFLVASGYNIIMQQLQATIDQTYGNKSLQQVLACTSESCTSAKLAPSLQEIHSAQRAAIKR
jgi:MFS superfamily sulfate permease-like transporter